MIFAGNNDGTTFLFKKLFHHTGLYAVIRQQVGAIAQRAPSLGDVLGSSWP